MVESLAMYAQIYYIANKIEKMESTLFLHSWDFRSGRAKGTEGSNVEVLVSVHHFQFSR